MGNFFATIAVSSAHRDASLMQVNRQGRGVATFQRR
jgi:hypothetical protein